MNGTVERDGSVSFETAKTKIDKAFEIYVAGRLSKVGSNGVEKWTEEYDYDKLREMLGLEKETITSGEMKDLMNSENGEERLQAISELIAQNFANDTMVCTV